MASALLDEAEKLDRAVRCLVRAAAGGDIAAAKALIPWLDQALGKPTERVEHRVPSTLAELETLSDEDLERLVAQGRADRLRREREAGEHDDDDDEPDWRARIVE